MPILITKMNGEQEPFDEKKLMFSLKRAGASVAMQSEIVKKIKKGLVNGMTTQEIYQKAFDILRKTKSHAHMAARYSIKRAILDLGPSGFPFERFVAEIFRHIGYKHVRSGIAMQGNCAPHEVDLYAVYKNQRIAGELKFHNSLGIKTDLKVALYVHSRFLDLGSQIDQGWLITNTRFTRNAIRYGNCNNMRMIGWDYPAGRGIESLIDKANVHPITALTTLKQSQKRTLLDDDIVLVQTVLQNPSLLKSHGVAQSQVDAVLSEAEKLCSFKESCSKKD